MEVKYANKISVTLCLLFVEKG